MTVPNFDEMTLDEIDEWVVAKKAEIRVLQNEYHLSAEARHNRVYEAHLAEAVKWLTVAAEVSGKTLDQQAKYWLTDEMAEDPGHRVQATLYLRSVGVI